MKRIVLLTAMAAAGMLMLVGCGSKAPEGYYILDSVTSVSDDNAADCLTAQGLDKSYLVLNGSEGYLVLMGTPEDISYKSETGVISTSFGDIPASVRGDVLTLADKNVVMQFKSSDKPAPAKPAYPTPPEPEPEPEPEVINEAEEEPEPEEQEEPAPAITEAMDDFWNGYWFGYWTVDPVESVWKDHEGYQFYVLAR
ncbi:MAG: hypothetical protein IKS16_07640, partial [Lachnospiraceae bacterium]|nr:hypothetical protein [Lachnospiraceae bacterium]